MYFVGLRLPEEHLVKTDQTAQTYRPTRVFTWSTYLVGFAVL